MSRVAASDGAHWTGRYLSMRNTYVELFGPGDAADAGASGPGSIGIALGSDLPGAIDALVARADGQGHHLDRSVQRRVFDGEEVDWFESARMPDQTSDTSTTVDVWAMEYVPSYFEHGTANKRPSIGEADRISRLRYNAGSYDGALLEDLVAADFAIDRDVFATRVRPMLVAAGFDLGESREGAHASGPETSLTFAFASSTGLRELRFRLTSDVASVRSEVVGRSTLSIGPGRAARWSFDRP